VHGEKPGKACVCGCGRKVNPVEMRQAFIEAATGNYMPPALSAAPCIKQEIERPAVAAFSNIAYAMAR